MMKSWLLDTNVLIYSYDETQPHHPDSHSLLRHAIVGDIPVVVAQQNLLEFLAVVTNPKRVNHPLSLDEALQKVAFYVASFPVISPSGNTFFTFATLLSRYKPSHQKLFDFYLPATA